MAARALTALFDDYDAAASAVDQLEAAGIPHTDISIISNRADTRRPTPQPSEQPPGGTAPVVADATDSAGTGATVGTVLGGSAACSPASDFSPYRVSVPWWRPGGWWPP